MIQANKLRWLGVACIVTAVLSGLCLGTWEHVSPFFGHARYQVAAPPLQRFVHAFLQTLKAFGFLAGLIGFFLVATRQGLILKITLGLATLGAIFYSIVWIVLAMTARDDAIYIFRRPIGSDIHSNGGAFFLWLAPIVLGVAALFAHRISRWRSIWPIIVGLAGLRIFGIFPTGVALIIEGIIWAIFGAIVYLSSGGAEQIGTRAAGAPLATSLIRRRVL